MRLVGPTRPASVARSVALATVSPSGRTNGGGALEGGAALEIVFGGFWHRHASEGNPFDEALAFTSQPHALIGHATLLVGGAAIGFEGPQQITRDDEIRPYLEDGRI